MKKEKQKAPEVRDDKYYYASQWRLMGRKFRRHKLVEALVTKAEK